jgi:hypothetical protein
MYYTHLILLIVDTTSVLVLLASTNCTMTGTYYELVLLRLFLSFGKLRSVSETTRSFRLFCDM